VRQRPSRKNLRRSRIRRCHAASETHPRASRLSLRPLPDEISFHPSALPAQASALRALDEPGRSHHRSSRLENRRPGRMSKDFWGCHPEASGSSPTLLQSGIELSPPRRMLRLARLAKRSSSLTRTSEFGMTGADTLQHPPTEPPAESPPKRGSCRDTPRW
jgi:hypothetical protein